MNPGGDEWITPGFTLLVIGIACALFIGWFIAQVIQINAAHARDLPMLTDAAQWCATRGRHVLKPMAGTGYDECQQCGHTQPSTRCGIGRCPERATQMYDRHPSGVLAVCETHATNIRRSAS